MSKHKKNDEDEITLKILLLGDTAVGKTSILLKYTDGYFPEIYVSTIGVEYKSKKIIIDGNIINLQIWDTAGQERYKSITTSFLKGADGILFVYDITNKPSFVNLKRWIRDSEEATQNFQKVIIGNKKDNEIQRKVPHELLKKFCNDMNLKGFETSAKTGKNINESFEELIKMIVGGKTKDELTQKFKMTSKERGVKINSENKKFTIIQLRRIVRQLR